MKWSGVFLLFLNLVLIAGLVLYMINPGGDAEFSFKSDSRTEFNLNNDTMNMQFYENMRFPDKRISYLIDDACSLKKKNSMKRAFDIIENLTVLEFYPLSEDFEIEVTCQEKVVMNGGLFIAGEGGPINITDGDKYSVILDGSILLIKDSLCPRPNVEIHELLHVLGFNHSDNENNLMYPVSKCNQVISEDILEKINELYLEESYSDLNFESANAEIDGRNLDLNLSIRNSGLKDSEEAIVKIYFDDTIIKELDLAELEIGYGVKIELKNIWLKKIKTEELKVVIETNFNELSKENNEIILIKNKS